MKTLTKMSMLALLLASFTAQADDSCKLTVWEAPSRAQSLSDIVKTFKQDTNCTVEIKEIDIKKQLSMMNHLSETQSNTPDVFIIEGDRINVAKSKDLIAPSTYMAKNYKKYLDLAREQVQVDGEYYAIPRSVETYLVYYNRDLIEYPLEDLNAYIKLNEEMMAKGKYGLVTKLDDFYTAYTFLGTEHSSIIDHEHLNVNGKDISRKVSFLQKYAQNYIPAEVLKPNGWEVIDTMFKDGKIAAVISNASNFSEYAQSGVNYGVAALPLSSDGKSLTPFYNTYNYAVSSKSKRKNMAELFISYINSPSNAYDRYLQTAELTPINDLLNSDLIVNDDFSSALFAQVEKANSIPSDRHMDQVADVMSTALHHIEAEGYNTDTTFNSAISDLQF